MPMFVSRPKTVEAEQFKFNESLPFQADQACCLGPDGWYVTTIHGHETPIADGDWIIREPDGVHFYPCKPDIFEANYILH